MMIGSRFISQRVVMISAALAVVLVFLSFSAGTVLDHALSATNSGPSASKVTSASLQATITALEAASPPAAGGTWKTIAVYAGNGDFTSSYFTPNSSEWRMSWTCVPQDFVSQYNVSVDVYYPSGQWADPAAINALCMRTNASGTTYFHNLAGNFYLGVISESVWTIRVESYQH